MKMVPFHDPHNSKEWMMTLDQLLAFQAVARDQSFQKAAEALHLTQPAVSKQIQALERELGGRLLDRGRKTRLTHAGEVLLKYAERVAQTVEAAREELSDVTKHGEGRLSIGASHSLALSLLPRLLETYRSDYPRVTVSVTAGHPAEILPRVAAGDFDLGLVILVSRKLHHSLPLSRRAFAVTDIVFVASPNDPIVTRREMTIDALRHAAWVLNQDGCQYRGFLEKKFAERGLTMNIAVEVMGLEVQKKLAQLGLGVTLLPKPFVAQELREGKLKRFTVKGVALQSFSCIVHRRDKYMHAAMRAFLELLARLPSNGASVGKY
jgi:DNA-binding transcriptional LysR family regulator